LINEDYSKILGLFSKNNNYYSNLKLSRGFEKSASEFRWLLFCLTAWSTVLIKQKDYVLWDA